tara:strand:+ start:45471 stop:47033 length:1563 start_codon:yes stop_codon:yes gene_type:complete
MLNRLSYLLFTIIPFFGLSQEHLLAPISTSAKSNYILSGEGKAIQNGYFPITNSEANISLEDKDSTRGWFYRKLFQEHFVQKDYNHFFLAVDPIVNIAGGDERLQNNDEFLFRNTRGAQAMGQLGKKFTFYTAFFENQARFVDYRTNYFESRGEQRFNGVEYVSSNAVIPNGGRTKPFKTSGFDYASSVSYLEFKPIESLTLHLGNDPSFIGWGHRSMLLSDNSFNFTHLRLKWQILPWLDYTVLRGKQLNLLRKRITDLVEPPFERKGIGIHYLTVKPIESLSIGLFESSIYLRDEALSDNRVSGYFYQPMIGLNTAIIGPENGEVRNFFGLNLGWRFLSNHMTYAQVISGDLSSDQYGLQIGYRGNNLFGIKNLNVQAEFNKATDRLYAARNRRMAYTHFNLPLAHTLGNGFDEALFKIGYRWKGIYLNVSHIYYSANEMMQFKTALFGSKSDFVQNTPEVVHLSSVEIGYLMNPKTRLTVFAEATYRQSTSDLNGNINHGLIFLGLRSDLFNSYTDF